MVEIENNKEIEKIERKGWGYQPFDYGLEDEEVAEQFEKSHKKRKEIVRQVLDGWEKSRDNDTLLYWECLRTEFPEIEVTSSKERVIFKIPKKIVKFLPPPESYRRPRQQFNAHNEFLSKNPDVIIRRAKREIAVRNFFASEKYKEMAKGLK